MIYHEMPRSCDPLLMRGLRICIKKILLYIISIVIIIVPGCVNGPVRYKTLGYKKYATTELFKCSPHIMKPVGGLIGMPVDALVIVSDSIIRPVYNIYLTSKCGVDVMGEGSGVLESIKYTYENEPYYLPLVLVITPVSYVAWYSLVFTTFTFIYTDKEAYADFYGNETGIFKDHSNESQCARPKAIEHRGRLE